MEIGDLHDMVLGKEWDAKQMLHQYMYSHMNKLGFHKAAETFAEEANIEMSELGNDGSMLEDWWCVFWPQFYSKMTKHPGGNPESSAQVGIFQQPPTGNAPAHVNYVAGQPPEGLFQTPPGDSQRRAGKRPMNTDTTSILGHSVARGKGKGPLGFPPVQLLPTDYTPVPHPNNPSHLQMLGTIQPPPQIAGDFRSVQLYPTYPAGQNLAYPPTAPIAGENNWMNQEYSTVVRLNAPNGPNPDSFRSHVPVTFLELMQQVAEEQRRR